MSEFIKELSEEHTKDFCNTLNEINQNIKHLDDKESGSFNLSISGAVACSLFRGSSSCWTYIQVQERTEASEETEKKTRKSTKKTIDSSVYLDEIVSFYDSFSDDATSIFIFNIKCTKFFQFYRDYKKEITTIIFAPEFIQINTSIRNVSFRVNRMPTSKGDISDIELFLGVFNQPQIAGYALDADELTDFSKFVNNMNALTFTPEEGYFLNDSEVTVSDGDIEMIFSKNSLVKCFTKAAKKGDSGIFAAYETDNPEMSYVVLTQAMKKFEVIELFKVRKI